MNDRVHAAPLAAGLLFVLIGVGLLLDAVDVVRMDLTLLWPVALIVVGLVMLLRQVGTAGRG